MALQFSTEYHSTPPVQFPSNNPPYVPNVQVLPEAQPLLVFISAAVANEAGIFSTNSPARMFCYNLLASNGWANSEFGSVVKLACDAAVLKCRMSGANTAASMAVDAVREVLTLYTSMLVVSHPELAQIVSPQQVQAAAANNQVYQDMINQINNLYAQTVNYQPPQAMSRQMPGQVVSNRPPMGQPRTMGGQALTNKAVGGLYQGSAPQKTDSPPSRFQKPIKTTVEKESPAAPVVDQSVLTGEIENMDRAQHSIVYFGKSFEIPTAPIRRKLEEAVEKHEELAKAEESVATPYINTSWVAATSLDELIALYRARHYAVNDGAFGTYVEHGLVAVPVISPLDLSGLFKELAKSATFSDVARVLIEYPDCIIDKEALKQALAAISQIDRIMTRLLMDFLSNMIDRRGLTITSFTEDVKSVASYLNTKFDGKYNSAYMNYQRQVLAHLFQHTRAGGNESDEVREIIDYGSDVYWDNLVRSYTIMFITASSQELGYDVTSTGKEIRGKETPLLRRLIDAIQKSNEKSSMAASHHILVTTDDARYGIFPINGSFDTYQIVSL